MYRTFKLLFLLNIYFYALPVGAVVTIREVSTLSFGMLEIPASGSTVITIDYDSGLTSGTATLVHNSTSRGQYLLSSDMASETVTLDIQNISTGASSLRLENFKGRYNGQVIDHFPTSALSVPQSGALLNLGASLTFSSALSEQSYPINFDIVVNYE